MLVEEVEAQACVDNGRDGLTEAVIPFEDLLIPERGAVGVGVFGQVLARLFGFEVWVLDDELPVVRSSSSVPRMGCPS